jgi:hypothetical protein
MIKRSSAGGNPWIILDTMRGMSLTSAEQLYANSSVAAYNAGTPFVNPTATGFNIESAGSDVNGSGSTYIYIAIRRGPMKVPTVGTSVYYPLARTGTGANATISTVPFAPDVLISSDRNGSSQQTAFYDKLRGIGTQGGGAALIGSSTTTEQNYTDAVLGYTNTGIKVGAEASSVTINYVNEPFITWYMQRAPSFMDEVCYTGTGANTTFTHNLGVVPELMIIKSRSDAFAWRVYTAPTGNTGYMVFNANDAFGTSSATWNNTSPTSSVFTVGTPAAVNNSGSTFVAYLFASVAGVSKVGSYTGTGSTLTVDCGFPSGVRFVMVKRTNNLGSWWVWDTARGMVSGTDPRLAFNSTSAETNTNWVYSVSTGFQVVSTNSEVNSSGDTYIFLAIA